jgi:hypothetical protein
MKTRTRWGLPTLVLSVPAVLVLITVGMLPWLAIASHSLDQACYGLSFVVHFQAMSELDETLPRRLCAAYLESSQICNASTLQSSLHLATIPWEALCQDQGARGRRILPGPKPFWPRP